MTDDRKPRARRQDQESGEPGGGAGRRDEAGGSGVYPASGSDAPEDAVVRTPGEWGKGAGGVESGPSELHFTDEELRHAKESSGRRGRSRPGRKRDTGG
ncbi:MAG: hypothetical protein ACREKM_06615 [Longimicrobiales bacterium]